MSWKNLLLLLLLRLLLQVLLLRSTWNLSKKTASGRLSMPYHAAFGRSKID
jgi:hypothetical protein